MKSFSSPHPPKKLSFPSNLQVIIVLLPQSVYSSLQYSCHTPGREVVKTNHNNVQCTHIFVTYMPPHQTKSLDRTLVGHLSWISRYKIANYMHLVLSVTIANFNSNYYVIIIMFIKKLTDEHAEDDE